MRAHLKSGSAHAGRRLIHVEPLVIRPNRGVVQNTSSKPRGQAMACIHGFEPSTSIEVSGLEGLSFQVVEVKEMVPCVFRPLELGNPAIQTLGGDVLSDSVKRVLWVAPHHGKHHSKC